MKEEMVLVGRYRTEDFFSVQNALVDVLGKENVSLEPSGFRDVVVFVRRDCLPTASPLLRPDGRVGQSVASQEAL